ncbi:hypothetical protein VUJ46_21485 [Chryseobacterium sp. MYb264]|uniref:hypothetical protein n=1 Tax=Chryseobacterium sp. MYb264 TaxID=2745153 RepID=UPI002E0D95CD|nr:hypothetical protein VUJ46_21485 [Chryseobacterium sp. MYb264]
MKRSLLLLLLLTSLALCAQINLNITSTAVGTAPVSSFFSYSYVQQIYTRQEINANAAGDITGLTFYVDPSVTLNDSSNWTVYLGHTSKISFTSGTDWVPSTQLTQVFSGNVTRNNNKVEVSFTVPFAYNNTDNLLIAAKENAPSIDINNFDEVFKVYSHIPYSTLFYKGDQAVVDVASPPGGIRADYKSAVTFAGLTSNTTPACASIYYPISVTQLYSLSPNIKWAPEYGANSYKISVGTTPGGTDVINQQSLTGTNYTLPNALNRGTTYYIKVSSVSNGIESSGCTELVLAIPPAPVNDACSGALLASTFPYSYTQNDAISATNNSGNIAVCADAMNDGLWFKLIGDGSQYKITVIMPADSPFDPQLDVYAGTCSSLSCVANVDNYGAATAETATITTTAGVEYYINVGSYEETVDVPESLFNITINKL